MANSGHKSLIQDIKAPIKMVAGVDLTAARLSAEEGFVLSRVDGGITVENLCLISGLGHDKTFEILAHLSSQGLIQIGDQQPAKQRQKTPTGKKPGPRPASNSNVPRQSQPTPSFSNLDMDARELVKLLQEDGPEINLKPEFRAKLRTFHAKLGEMTFFQLLDEDLDVGATANRRAYFKQSKVFHPDRYFNKTLGPYKSMLQNIFKQLSSAYKFLEDKPQREAYRQMVLQDQEQESQLKEVQQQGAQALRDVGGGTPPGGVTRTHTSEYLFCRKDLHRKVKHPDPGQPGRTETASYGKVPSMDSEREKRRSQDRKRRRKQVLASPMMDRAKQAKGFYDQGVQQLEQGKVMAAAASLKLAVSFHPEEVEYSRLYNETVEKARVISAENLFKRGMFEESVDRHTAAKKLLIQALALDPKTEYLLKASEVMMGDDLPAAKDYATKAVQNEPDSVAARLILARVFNMAGMNKDAHRELQHALKIDPGNKAAKDLQKLIMGS